MNNFNWSWLSRVDRQGERFELIRFQSDGRFLRPYSSNGRDMNDWTVQGYWKWEDGALYTKQSSLSLPWIKHEMQSAHDQCNAALSATLRQEIEKP